MGFKRGALLGPFRVVVAVVVVALGTSLLNLSAQQASVECLLKARRLSALGSLRWTPRRKCQPPAFLLASFFGTPAVAPKTRCLPCPVGGNPGAEAGFLIRRGRPLVAEQFKVPTDRVGTSGRNIGMVLDLYFRNASP